MHTYRNSGKFRKSFRLYYASWTAAFSGSISENFRNFGLCLQKASPRLVSGKSVRCNLHISAHFNQLTTPTRNIFFAHMHTYRNSGKFRKSFRLYYVSRNGPTACLRCMFRMGDARTLYSSKFGPSCLQAISLPSAWRANTSEGVGGRFLNFVNSFGFFRSKGI